MALFFFNFEAKARDEIQIHFRRSIYINRRCISSDSFIHSTTKQQQSSIQICNNSHSVEFKKKIIYIYLNFVIESSQYLELNKVSKIQWNLHPRKKRIKFNCENDEGMFSAMWKIIISLRAMLFLGLKHKVENWILEICTNWIIIVHSHCLNLSIVWLSANYRTNYSP